MTTSPLPFARVMIPYDGSEPAQAALQLGISLAQRGAQLTIVSVVDEAAVISQSATTLTVYDPTPLLNALDEQGSFLLADAVARCAQAGIAPGTRLVHEQPVAGIVSAAQATLPDLIIMGTHARTGVPRFFLGSTTEGVLRSALVPVLTVRGAVEHPDALFQSALIAIDESECCAVAVSLAAAIAAAVPSKIYAFHATDNRQLYSNAVAYGFDPRERAAENQQLAERMIADALAHAVPPLQAIPTIVDGEPAATIVAVAKELAAGCIIIGTHGRRGLQRVFLGSVAETVVRTSEVPVLVVPPHRRAAATVERPAFHAATVAVTSGLA